MENNSFSTFCLNWGWMYIYNNWEPSHKVTNFKRTTWIPNLRRNNLGIWTLGEYEQSLGSFDCSVLLSQKNMFSLSLRPTSIFWWDLNSIWNPCTIYLLCFTERENLSVPLGRLVKDKHLSFFYVHSLCLCCLLSLFLSLSKLFGINEKLPEKNNGFWWGCVSSLSHLYLETQALKIGSLQI
jgi:hypothetical protein